MTTTQKKPKSTRAKTTKELGAKGRKPLRSATKTPKKANILALKRKPKKAETQVA